MSNGNGRKDIEWLRGVVRKHFKRSWRQVFAALKARQAGTTPMHLSARTEELRPSTHER